MRSAAVLLVAVLSAASVEAPEEAARLERAAGFAQALSRAERDDRLVLAAFQTLWCGYCRKLERTTYRDPEFVKLVADNLVFVLLDFEDDGEGSKAGMRYRIDMFPTLLLLDGRGEELKRIRGYRTADELIEEVRGVLREHAKKDAPPPR